MSIANEITRLQNAKAALKESITAKGVTVEDTAKLDEYPALVDNIEQGSSKIPSIYDDVIFIDYDGTLLYTYTKEEFLNLNVLPQLPNHDELKDAEWNWSLNGAKERVRVYDKMVIGASYNIVEEGLMYYVKVYEAPSSINQVTLKYSGYGGDVLVDWGDGNTNRYTDTGNNKYARHHYGVSGNFKIKVTTESTTIGSRQISIDTLYSGYAYLNKCVFNDNYLIPNASSSNYNPSVIFYGKNSLYSSNMYLTGTVDIILIAKNISGNYQDNYLFASQDVCRFCAVIPNNVVQNIKVKNCNIICLPETVQPGGSIVLQKVTGRLPICCPNIAITETTNTWYLESAIQVQLPPTENIGVPLRLIGYNNTLIIPEGVVTITSILANTTNVFTMILPSTITTYTPSSDASFAHLYCYAAIPPTITGFSGSLTSIYVPAESVEAYKAATNWSAYADKIFPIPTE